METKYFKITNPGGINYMGTLYKAGETLNTADHPWLTEDRITEWLRADIIAPTKAPATPKPTTTETTA